MALTRRRPRVRFVVVFLLLASLTLITLDERGGGSSTLTGIRNDVSSVLSPIQRVVHDALRPVGNFLTGAVDYGKVEAENARLRREIQTFRNQQTSTAYAQQQADQVLRQSHLSFAGGVKQVPAQVIDVGSSNFASTVTIDKGTSSGLRIDQPVVAAGGLAGTVSSVTSHTATVTLVTDPTFVVGVRLPGANVGSADGQGPDDNLKVTVLPANLPAPTVRKGEVLSTSGLSMENFPPGIPVGTVASVSIPAGESEPVISLKPLADGANLQYLEVLLWSPQ